MEIVLTFDFRLESLDSRQDTGFMGTQYEVRTVIGECNLPRLTINAQCPVPLHHHHRARPPYHRYGVDRGKPALSERGIRYSGNVTQLTPHTQERVARQA
ncbi:hypothetical protein ASPCADRAFT_6045 [Aspergillus carbonarius ITEM 5010]|uniref:Uncharacterized protein n=1 Tax=Aspergillus carbonarius (strain ITEM 5010) TaxID=602072 RepID=A0A1R3RM17_ASPC5|nr:hypothetical protein ASPCADRAFT_6045 [Aspergillus carbonarius ITEM 5010]